MLLRATLNEPVPLQALANDGNTGLFVRVTVLSPTLVVVATLYPLHVVKGLYSVNWTPTSEGYYSAIYEFFTDPGYTTVAYDYPQQGETVEVNSDKTNILRLLALEHENTVLDQHTYDGAKRLLTSRLRGYNSAANAALAGVTGLLFEWHISATYDGLGRNNLFKIDRVL
jgi:hypothetical protein